MAIETELLDQFDKPMAQRGYTNRSEAFRDLARAELVKEATEKPNSNVVGSLTIVYDHHVGMLSERLTELQHQHYKCVVSSMHVHLDHDHCLEVIVLRGRAKDVRHAANLLISIKGVKHGHLTMAVAETPQP